jgi:hypothetical protein
MTTMAPADSTTRIVRRRSATVLVALVAALLAVAVSVARPASARADGDPASDVLATQDAFVPADGGLTATSQAQLAALVAAAQRSGFPLRVALIAGPADLGSIGALWRQPQAYAQFLGVELSLVFHGTLLVVMPNGYGVDHVGGATGPPASALGAGPAAGEGIGAAAIAAVARLASAAGHPLSSVAAIRPVAGAGAAGSWLSSVDLGSWLALIFGALLAALAWTVSLRTRPARLTRAARPARPGRAPRQA